MASKREDKEFIYTPASAAKLSGLTESSVRRRMRDGRIPTQTNSLGYRSTNREGVSLLAQEAARGGRGRR